MDCDPNICEMKQENLDGTNESNLDFTYVERVKLENDVDWSIQTMLTLNQYQENDSLHTLLNPNLDKDETQRLRYISNVKYQEIVKTEEVKHEIDCPQDVPYTTTNYQDKISYEELKEENLQSCISCGMYFLNSYSLFCHNLIHLKIPLVNQKVYMCAHCPKFYKRRKNLKHHIHIDHYKLIANFNKNYPRTKQTHKCLLCNKTYTYKTWISHRLEVHCKRRLKCQKCERTFKARRYLKRHNASVHQKTLLYKSCKPSKEQCPKCPATLDSWNALTTHLRNCHSDEKYTCPLCKSTLKCKAYLLTHMRRVHHNDGIIHACSLCRKEFKSKRYLKIHMKNSHIKKGKL